MPLRSMTGFGQYDSEENGLTQMWEIRSVNSRHLDPKWRLPVQVRSFEPAFDKVLRKFASRGRVEITLLLHDSSRADAIQLDTAQASALLNALNELAVARGQDFIPDYTALIGMPQLWLSNPKKEESLYQVLEQGFICALEDWNRARETEAVQLAEDLRQRFAAMAQWVDQIVQRAPVIKEERFGQVRERLTEMLAALNADLDENRFLQEMVILADRLDVSEELTRLKSHLQRLAQLLAQGVDTGRKLDFTLQECFREINTCGNKIQDVSISHLVVEFKNELEKCREQVQNLE